jgi:PPOX class probable FMN-dependent enzyme
MMKYQTLHSVEELEALYPKKPGAATRRAEVDRITPELRVLIEEAQFIFITTSGRGAIDVSPRGGPSGAIAVQDEQTLLLADLPGNGRIDSMRNLLGDPRAGLLFFVPGLADALCARATVTISTDPQLLQRYEERGRVPASVWVIRVHSLFFQHNKAALRSGLWEPGANIDRALALAEPLKKLVQARADELRR